MIKLFLITLLCVAFAQSEPDINNDLGLWFENAWNFWRESIEEIRDRLKNGINNHHEIEQRPTVEETSPTGTPDSPGATNPTEITNPIEVSTTTGASNPTGSTPISS